MAANGFTSRKLKWLDRVACDGTLPGGAIRVAVLLCLRFLNADTASAWASVTTLATALGTARRVVQRDIAALVRGGYLLVEIGAGPGGTNVLRMPDAAPEGATKKSQGERPAGRRGGDHGVAGGATCWSPNPISEPISEPVSEPSISCESTSGASGKSIPAGTDHFPAFWRAFPRRIARAAAERAWLAALRGGADPLTIIAAAERFAARRSAEEPDAVKRERFTPHPASWLNGQRWHDEPGVSDPITLDGVTGEPVHARPSFEAAPQRPTNPRRPLSALEIARARRGSIFTTAMEGDHEH